MVIKKKFLNESDYHNIYLSYLKEILKFVYGFVYDIDIAEDLAQEVFIRAFENIKKGGVTSKNVRAWLYRIAANHCINAREQTKVRERYINDLIKEKTSKSNRSQNSQADQVIDSVTIDEIITFIKTNFSEKENRIFELKYFHKIVQSDIAIIMDTNVADISRTLKRMCTAIEEKFHNFI